jgi:hypothetical protein
MAFPANYNIQYYQGDTYQFIIRPKTSAGEIFPVTDTEYDAYFRIDIQRGREDGLGIEAPASIGDNSVTCTITPAVGNNLVAGTTYFYDVSIESKNDPNAIFTLLTGTLVLTADIAAGP